MVKEETVRGKYAKITSQLIQLGITVTTMESCTSGFIASLLTDATGASAALKGAYVTYSNEAKIKNGVAKEIIEEYGVYSEQTACDMASACKKSYHADIGIGVTGTLGSIDANNPEEIADTVYFTVNGKKEYTVHMDLPEGNDRFHYKVIVADAVADVLLTCIYNDFEG